MMKLQLFILAKVVGSEPFMPCEQNTCICSILTLSAPVRVNYN